MNSRLKKSLTQSNREEYPRKTVQCEDGKTREERGRKFAKLTTSPELAAFRVINGADRGSSIEEQIDVPTLMEILKGQGKAVNTGDLTQAEAMLMNQATALQTLFARLTEKAFSTERLPHFDSFMRMALRAQNQCRATLDTLAAIKNPPLIYARQANFAHGNQQVNNGGTEPVTHAGNGEGGDRDDYRRSFADAETEKRQNELLIGGMHGQTVDIGTTSAAFRINAAVEALGEVNGSKDTKG